LTGRRTCSKCGAIWHVEFKPTQVAGKCDSCGADLTQRSDDREEVVRQRLEAYRSQTEPLLQYYAGRVPLVLKLNGKTEIPSDDEALSPLNASVEDAVRLGADAVGYTLYVGSPAQERDFDQLSRVRQDATRFGMPLIVWSYPRGKFVNAKGGQLTSWAIEYAARTAQELGADVVKVNLP
jgi:DhnA family fructose-bisphosphate aldolase class Ia